MINPSTKRATFHYGYAPHLAQDTEPNCRQGHQTEKSISTRNFQPANPMGRQPLPNELMLSMDGVDESLPAKVWEAAIARRGVERLSDRIANRIFSGKGSVCYSPVTFPLLFGMILKGLPYGAEGKSRFLEKLVFKSMMESRVHAGLAKLAQDFESARNNKIQVVNTVALHQGLFKASVNPFFKATIEEVYKGQILTYAGNVARDVNRWVAEQTRGAINEIFFDEGVKRTELYFVEAVDAGKWTARLDAMQMLRQPFCCADGREAEVCFVKFASLLPYYKSKYYSMVQLPLGNTEGLSCCVFVPEKNCTFKDFRKALTSQEIEKSIGGSRRETLSITMPKIKIDGLFDLNPTLEFLRLPVYASLSNLSDISQHISVIAQKTIFELNFEAQITSKVEILNKRHTFPEMIQKIVETSLQFFEGKQIEFAVRSPHILVVVQKGETGIHQILRAAIKDEAFLQMF